MNNTDNRKNKEMTMIARTMMVIIVTGVVVGGSVLGFAQPEENKGYVVNSQVSKAENGDKTVIEIKLEKETPQAKADLSVKKEGEGEYTLGKDDQIEITVRRHPEFSGQFVIGVNGKIQYPFIGDITLEDLTKTQAVDKIKDILGEYIEAPEVDVTIMAYNSKVVYILGHVARPGKYPMHAEFMPLREAVIAAGLPRENTTALRRALIVRPREGQSPIVKRVNLYEMLYFGKLEYNYDLRDGDIVYLPSTMLYKVSTVLSQILDPTYKAAVAVDTYDDIQDRRD